jgi:molybdopterin synthase sulfur carrier subunit
LELRFHATLRQFVGGRNVDVAFQEGLTVRGLLEQLIARYPALGPQLFDEANNLHRHVHVFVNGRDAPYLDHGLDTVLQADASLDVFPPVGGGTSGA